jgi:hypothetical protein
MLSVAVAACVGAPAFADPYPIDDITTVLTAPITTATANTDGTPADIKIDTGGGITVTVGGPAVTINSNNSFDQIAGTTISNKGTDAAVGILVDLTTQSLDATNDAVACPAGDCHVVEGIVENGTIDLSGSGATKRGLWLEGQAVADGVTPFTFTGNIDMSNSTMTITGDSSVGVLIDEETILNGSLTLGNITIQTTSQTTSTLGVIGLETSGTINGDINVGLSNDDTTVVSVLKALGSTSSGAGGTIGLKLGGTINGDVTIAKGSQIFSAGTGSQGILLTGDINPCDAAVAPDCTSLGSLVNNGVIETVGSTTQGADSTGNPTSGAALAIGGSIAGGILNAGPTGTDNSILAGLIEAQSFAPVIEISPTLANLGTSVPLEIGVYAGDTDDQGFGLYNRGSILAVSSNINQSTQAFLIVGAGTDATATLDGGLFNSGTIQSTVTTNGSAANPSIANAISIGANAVVGGTETYHYDSGCDCMVYDGNKAAMSIGGQDDRAALVNSNELVASGGTQGTILANISGPFSGNSATAISIGSGATLPSIINSGLIQATATSSDTTISNLHATAIVDASGTLTYIQNNGSIQALATTLKDGSQTAVAIDLSLDKGVSGVEILNQATTDQSANIIGDIKFGSGDHQILRVLGASTDEQAIVIGDITFGGGSTAGTDELTIGNFATVTGTVLANADMGVNVDIQNNGTLVLQNDETALNASSFHVEAGGELDLTVLEEFKTGIIASAGPVTFDQGAKLSISYGSFVPENSTFVLATAPTGDIQVPDIQIYRDQLAQSLPFLFQSADLQIQPGFNPGTDEFALIVDPKTASQLGLTGYAVQMLPLANQALVNDDPLGAAMVAGIVDQKSAQQAYDQYAPDVTGGARAIAMSLTDQATGPVASRQRILRMYGKASGEITLWGQEFAQFIKDPGNTDTGQTGFKDHGFGFVLGMDGGDPKSGWYGGAFTFYSGDVVEALPRDSHTNTLWYMLSGYTDWRGRGLFLDTKLDVGYVNLKSKRFLNLTIPSKTGGDPTHFIDEADGNRPGLVGSAGFTTGVILAYGATTISPQVSVDAMTLREEGYSESHPTTAPGNGNGFKFGAGVHRCRCASGPRHGRLLPAARCAAWLSLRLPERSHEAEGAVLQRSRQRNRPTWPAVHDRGPRPVTGQFGGGSIAFGDDRCVDAGCEFRLRPRHERCDNRSRHDPPAGKNLASRQRDKVRHVLIGRGERCHQPDQRSAAL